MSLPSIIEKDIKAVIEVNRKSEERIYNILKDLSVKGESIIKNIDNPEDKKAIIKLGWRIKPLFDLKISDQPIIWNTFSTRKEFRDMRFIYLPRDVEVVESEGNNKSFFCFKRRKIH